ncbi:MAG: hypothetical protein ABGX08_17400 [Citromicrobium sp.]
MATCRDIVTRALRLSGVIRLSAMPTASEADYGMEGLQSLFSEFVNAEAFGEMTDKRATADYTAGENERITASAGVTVTLPTTIEDEDADDGIRTPHDLAMIEVLQDGVRSAKVYDRDGWVELLGLSLGNTCPLAHRGEHGLAALLALETMGPFAANVSQADIMAARRFKGQLLYRGQGKGRSLAAVYY